MFFRSILYLGLTLLITLMARLPLICNENFATELLTSRAIFTPPTGWRFADTKLLPEHVKLMVVGEGAYELPPSLNLGFEKYSGTLKDYLKIVKSINDSQGDAWRDLGNIKTLAGNASLSQSDIKTQWGLMRQMYVIYLNEGVIYILTAAALKKEFSKFYPAFFEAFKSFTIEK